MPERDLPVPDVRTRVAEDLPSRARLSFTRSALACMASSVSRAVVRLQRPESRSQSIDRPTKPSMPCTKGNTSSRM